MDYFPPVATNPQTPAAPQVQGIFDVDELMAFFKQTQMGAFFRQRVDPPDFLKPAFPDPDELRCVGQQGVDELMRVVSPRRHV
jgi:hypothetical protein